jgi:hypothetical protein
MASVRLGRYEAEDGDLPPVCMRCGEPAEEYRRKQFNWHPQWVYILLIAGLLVFVIVAVILTKWMRIRAPLCPAHTNHWLWRTLVVLLSLLLLVFLAIASIFLLSALERQPGRQHLFGFVCLGVVVLAVIWLIATIVIQMTAIRPTEITDRDITLTGVSVEFVDAYRNRRRRRRRPDEEDDYDRPARRRPRYEEDEDFYERRPRRRRDEDDYD